MDWGGCEQHLCLLAVGLKYQAQGKICCHPPLKYLDVKEGKEGDPGRAAPRTWLPLHIGEGLSFPKQREFSFLWAGDSTAFKIEMHDARRVAKTLLAFYFLVIQKIRKNCN